MKVIQVVVTSDNIIHAADTLWSLWCFCQGSEFMCQLAAQVRDYLNVIWKIFRS